MLEARGASYSNLTKDKCPWIHLHGWRTHISCSYLGLLMAPPVLLGLFIADVEPLACELAFDDGMTMVI